MRTDLQPQQHHRRGLSLSSAIANDRDDDLILFRDMHRKEQDRKLSIPDEPGLQTPMTPLQAAEQSLYKVAMPSLPIKSCGSDDILALDWLMTPPSTPLFLNGDRDSANNGMYRSGAASGRPTSKPSKLGEVKGKISGKVVPSSKSAHSNLGLKHSTNSAGSTALDSSTSRSLRSLGQNSNLATRPPTQSAIHSSRLTSTGANSSSRVSLSHPSAKTPASMSNGGIYATTSSMRSTICNGQSVSSSRPSTPLKRSPSPNHICNPPTTLVRCSSANRASSMTPKGATVSRVSSPTRKGWDPDAVNGICYEPLPSLHKIIQERPASISRSNKADHGECGYADIQNRRKSGSIPVFKEQATIPLQNGGKIPFRNGRVDTGSATSNCKVAEKALVVRKPTLGSKEGQVSMADLHVNKPTKTTSLRDVKSIFSSVRESSGFGRNVPKKSTDLNSKKMDAGKNTPYKFRSFMSSMAKPALKSKKLGKNGTYSASSVSDSPMATSSNASSEHNMSIVIDPDGSELGDECVSERGSRLSAASHHDLVLGREKRISSWLQSPEYKDDDADIMQIFEQEGLESLSGPESPLFTELEGTIECDNFSLDPSSQGRISC
ncbi:hypothetical protein L7F22_054787 [Adiantum nelumboides]|nr:hypothetical protein [Adiantum nelumboides]